MLPTCPGFVSTGCAPPVGAYDPKALETIPNCAVSKEDRFKVPKGTTYTMACIILNLYNFKIY